MRLLVKLRRFWFWLWTGYPSLRARRRAIEQDVHRFGGTVIWRD